jgi:ABC-type transport system involved in multi-copper enzyme maturation permease subunit
MSRVVIAETLRRHFQHLGYVAALLGIVIIVATMAAVGAPAESSYEMLSLFALVAGCQLIGPEFSSGTLQLILSKPIGRSTYLISRVIGVVLAIWVAVIVIVASDAVGRLASGNPIVWRTALSAAVVAAMKALLVCALLAFFGSFTRSYANVGIYIAAQIVLALIVGLLGILESATKPALQALAAFLRSHPGVREGMQAFSRNIFPSAPTVPFDRNWLLMIVTNAAIAVLLACVVFSRREVPYGAD